MDAVKQLEKDGMGKLIPKNKNKNKRMVKVRLAITMRE